MGTRDDEYDYLFKGEAVGSPTFLTESRFGGPGHSRGTRVRAAPALKSAFLSPSSLGDLSCGLPAQPFFPQTGSPPHTPGSLRPPLRPSLSSAPLTLCPSRGRLLSSKSSSFPRFDGPLKGAAPPTIYLFGFGAPPPQCTPFWARPPSRAPLTGPSPRSPFLRRGLPLQVFFSSAPLFPSNESLLASPHSPSPRTDASGAVFFHSPGQALVKI